MGDGVTLTSVSHPVAPWYKRLWLRIRYGRNRLNEDVLEAATIEMHEFKHKSLVLRDGEWRYEEHD